MNEKLKKLSISLSELIQDTETPQSVYDNLNEVMRKQSDYFNYLGPSNIIKLTIYIYSFKKTGKFTLGDSIISSLGFANLIVTDGLTYIKNCENCDSYGEIDCTRCNKSGRIECTKCDGYGETETNNGYGEIETNICSKCGGRGIIDCPNCIDGSNQCEVCEGSGEIETSELSYDSYFIVTWNNQIKNLCELKENTGDPVLSNIDFLRKSDEYILLKYGFNNHAEFENWVQFDEVYCTFYSERPNLKLTGEMKIDIESSNIEPYYYTI
jgi:hypothetical protein